MRLVALISMVAVWFAGPPTARADHCEGVFARAALARADRVVLVRLTEVRRIKDEYHFKTERTYLGLQRDALSVTGRAMSCRWPGGLAKVGDRYILIFGPPDRDGQELTAYWKLGGNGAIVDGTFSGPYTTVSSFADAEHLIERYAGLPDTWTAPVPSMESAPRPDFTTLAQFGLFALMFAVALHRRRRAR